MTAAPRFPHYCDTCGRTEQLLGFYCDACVLMRGIGGEAAAQPRRPTAGTRGQGPTASEIINSPSLASSVGTGAPVGRQAWSSISCRPADMSFNLFTSKAAAQPMDVKRDSELIRNSVERAATAA